MPDDIGKIIIKGIEKDLSEDKSLEIPVKKEDLGVFISSLLGQSQSIERELYGKVDIDHSWLINLHHLISQRIHQQAEASLINFSAEIFYAKGLKRSLNSFEAFETFNETKKEVSQSVRVKWVYLINFTSKNIPERQEVIFYASRQAPRLVKPEDPIRWMVKSRQKLGQVSYQINHTERTWGDDIENLLKVQIEEIVDKPGPALSIIETIYMVSAMIFLFGGILMPFYMDSFIENRAKTKLIENIGNLIKNVNISMESISGKLDALITLQDPLLKNSGVGWVYTLLSVIGGFIICMILIYLSERKMPSFIVLTKESEKEREKTLKRENRKTFIHILTFLLGISASIVANYIYYWISTK